MDSSSTIVESDCTDMTDNTSETMSDAADGEISVIDYARYHGLSKDYTSFNPLSPCVLHTIPTWEHSEPAQLPEFELPKELDLDEKWTIDHQSALFLRQITSMEPVPHPELTRQKKKSTEFKVEPPLLPTDPDLEQRRFMRARHSRQSKDSLELPPETLWEDDRGAALYWADPKLPETLTEQIKQEKLQLGKNDILFLQQCISLGDKPDTRELDTPLHRKVNIVFFR